MAVFQQFAVASQKTIHHFSYRGKISFQYYKLFSQLCDMCKSPWIISPGYLFFHLFNTVTQLFHYNKIMVNYHVEQ